MLVWSNRQAAFGHKVEELVKCMDGQHVPDCPSFSIPLSLATCECAGPNRREFVRSWAVKALQEPLDKHDA